MKRALALALASGAAALALLAVPSCKQSDEPGLAIAVDLSDPFQAMSSLRVTATTATGFAPLSPTEYGKGVSAQSDGTSFVVTFDASAGFSFTSTVTFLLAVKTNAPVDLNVSAQVFDRSGELIGKVDPVTATAQPGAQVPVNLKVTCLESGCAPLPDSGVAVISDAGIVDPESAASFKLAGAANTAPLATVAVCHLHGSDQPADLVVGVPLATDGEKIFGKVLVFYGSGGRDWTQALALSNPSLSITGQNAAVSGQTAENEQIGQALGCADLNGGGYDQLLIGAPKAGPARSHAGRVYVLDVKAMTDTSELSLSSFWVDGGMPAGLVAIIEGPAPSANAGAAVIGAHFHQSGKASLVIGAPANDADAGAGAVYLLGPQDFGGGQHLTLGQGTGTVVAGAGGDKLGAALAAGAFGGGSLDDLALGAPGTQAGGSVYLVHGGSAPDGGVLDLASATAVTGPASSSFGASLAVGDLDDDGTPDVVIGAPQARGSQNPHGAVFVLEGDKVGGKLITAAPIDVTAAARPDIVRASFSGPGDDAQFGSQVAVVLQSGAQGDLWVGAPGASNARGMALRILGGKALASQDVDTGTMIAALRVLGSAEGDRLGASVAGGSLESSNSQADLVVVAPGAGTNLGALYGFLNGTTK